jgi:hypothetical protein
MLLLRPKTLTKCLKLPKSDNLLSANWWPKTTEKITRWQTESYDVDPHIGGPSRGITNILFKKMKLSLY